MWVNSLLADAEVPAVLYSSNVMLGLVHVLHVLGLLVAGRTEDNAGSQDVVRTDNALVPSLRAHIISRQGPRLGTL